MVHIETKWKYTHSVKGWQNRDGGKKKARKCREREKKSSRRNGKETMMVKAQCAWLTYPIFRYFHILFHMRWRFRRKFQFQCLSPSHLFMAERTGSFCVWASVAAVADADATVWRPRSSKNSNKIIQHISHSHRNGIFLFLFIYIFFPHSLRLFGVSRPFRLSPHLGQKRPNSFLLFSLLSLFPHARNSLCPYWIFSLWFDTNRKWKWVEITYLRRCLLLFWRKRKEAFLNSFGTLSNSLFPSFSFSCSFSISPSLFLAHNGQKPK